MKKIITESTLFILIITLAVSCAPTVKVTTDYDRSANFSAYKTFTVDNFPTNVNDLNARRIWNSIRSEMIKKGYAENDNNPDLVVNVISVLKDRKYISATGNGWNGPYGYWGGGGDATFKANYYKDGSLMIHVVDVKTNRLLWEGIGNAEMLQQPKNPDEAISKAVAKIMEAFPQRSAN